MQKILVALNAADPDKKTLDFACFLGRLTKSRVSGVFLGSDKHVIKNIPETASIGQSEISGEEGNQLEANIEWFRQGCINREVNYDVRLVNERPVNDLIAESRFADLVVIGPETSISGDYEGRPSEFLKNTLKNAECPVIIAPERFDAIEEIVFTYDSSASSVYAIKQFTYLFPQLNNKKVTIVQINKTGKWEDAETKKFRQWLKAHYINLSFEAKKGDSNSELFEWLFKRNNTFIVMGAYGRTGLSQFFKHSHADLPIHILSQPIFITHL